MKARRNTSATRVILVLAVVGGALAVAGFVRAWRSDVRQLVRETEEYLAEQPLPSR